ncbi:MAG TPA: ABC transporter ATP-binding protein [Candidatus Limnocylindrales bacterium]|jgi:ATP-binding cassette subfamily B protein/subfamily B ATP-binding cassette protein MsbA|nr:ABC transporter ATP-binding protein [Candidatus Limnocylindrales bacterium]
MSKPPKQLLLVGLKEWRLLAAIVVLTSLTSLISVLKPWPLKILADVALDHPQRELSSYSYIPRLEPWSAHRPAIIGLAAAGSLAVYFLLCLLDAAMAWSWTALGQRLTQRLSVDLFRRILQLPLSALPRFRTGDLLSRLSTDTAALSKLMNGMLITPVTSLFGLSAMLWVAWRLDRELAAWCFATAPLMAVATVAFGRRVRKRNRRSREAQGRLASFVHQTLSAMPLVQVFHTGERNSQRLATLADEAATLTKRGLVLARSQALVTGLISVAGGAVIIYVGGRKTIAGTISVGTFLVFINYLRSAQRALESLLKLYGSFQPLWVGLERVCELLQPQRDEVTDTPTAQPLRIRPKRSAAICFEEVLFGYQAERPVLRSFSLALEPGESVALVGTSGAGKSTALSLIPRLYDPWRGRVLVNGQDVRELKLASLRAHISFVFQTPYLLRRKVIENIAFGRAEASPSAITAAARQARAHDFVARLSAGYETVVGEHGATLSGGEKQRLAIARAYLRDAPILILDEPTSACDIATEADLIGILRELARNKTVLIAAHRLSSIDWVDRIVVLENGGVVEMGSHEELLKREGRYYRFYWLQSPATPAEVSA